VRVIREIDARRRVGGAAAGVDAERADFPVGRNSPNRKEDKDQAGEEQQEAEPAATATVPVIIGNRHLADWRRDNHELPSQRRDNRLRSRCRDSGLGNRCREGGNDGLHD